VTDSAPWPKGIQAITLFVDDLAAAKDFYGSVFGVPIVFEDAESAAFNFGNTIVNLLIAGSASELIEPAPVGGPGGGARALMTVGVDDVDAVCAEVTRRGVKLLNGPIDRPWGPRTAAFADPSGHMWEIAK
jgi:catechol 2,3-dioxygenase-like lactoylglutathione lyase family enzyme